MKRKRLLSLVLALVMVISLLPTAALASNQGTISLTVGQTYTIKRDYWLDRTWSTSDSSVVKIVSSTRDSVTIEAVKAGTAVVTARNQYDYDTDH